MNEFTREITKAEYETLIALPADEARFKFCGASLIYGYGVYGFKLYEKDGRYFGWVRHGSTCD